MNKAHWKNIKTWKRGGLFFASSLGISWTTIEFIQFFLTDKTILPSVTLFIVVLVTCAIIAFLLSLPKSYFEHRVPGYDVKIAVRVGDLFSEADQIVIGVDNRFCAETSGIDPKSLHAQFISREFPDAAKLAPVVEEQLADIDGPPYLIGTAIRIDLHNRVAHWIAITEFDGEGNAHGTQDALLSAIAALWGHLRRKGGMHPVAVPVLGSRFARGVNLPRVTIIKETVRSFLAACNEDQFCQKLTIVLHPSDVAQFDIDLRDLNEFVALQVANAHLSPPLTQGRGTATSQ